MTPPWLSWTVPEMEPLLCAKAAATVSVTRKCLDRSTRIIRNLGYLRSIIRKSGQSARTCLGLTRFVIQNRSKTPKHQAGALNVGLIGHYRTADSLAQNVS